MNLHKPEHRAIVQAQTLLHHSWLLGLMLTVVVRKDPEVTGEWMFRLFRRQHLSRFLSSFGKLGLDHLPHAVACAKYHVLSNQIGGVRVEFMKENDQKAWLRFRYPRWMYAGPTLCAMPIEVSRGFLRGWYAHNGVSLGNPRLGFVCVSEDMSDDGFGLCGYFKEFDHDLTDAQRLQFSRELPPPFQAVDQPSLPAGQWPAERLDAAQRGYALDYLRNGIGELMGLIGVEEAREIATRSARLVGRQYYEQTAGMLGATDGDARDAARYLQQLGEGMAESVTLIEVSASHARLALSGLRIAQSLPEPEASVLAQAWLALLSGSIEAHQTLMVLQTRQVAAGRFECELKPRVRN